jgi:hypothetical protein
VFGGREVSEMARAATAGCVAVVALAVMSALRVARAESREGSGTWVSVEAGGSNRFGWWDLQVAPDGSLTSTVVFASPRHLDAVQMRTLARLLRALPTSKRKWRFGANYIDASTTFVLRVTTRGVSRTYSITDTLEDDAGRAEARAVAEVVDFLYGLLGSSVFIPPPRWPR